MADPKNNFSTKEIGQLLKSGSVVAAKRGVKNNFPLISVSENVDQLLGQSADTLLKSDTAWLNLIHPNDKVSVIDFYRSAAESEAFQSLEYKIQHSDGSYFLIREEIKPAVDDHGKKVLLSTIIKVPDGSIEKELRIRLEYQNVVSRCSNLLIESSGEETVNKVLELLLQTTDTDRVYIFTSSRKNNETVVSQIHEACREGVQPEIDNPDLQNMPFDSLPWVFGQVSSNKVVNIPIRELPSPEREFMQDQDIKSFLLLPVFIDDEWFGFMGFDSTRSIRKWEEYEISILRTAAEIIGTYFKRKTVEESLISQKDFTRQILNSLPSITVVLNKKMEVLQWNTLAEKLTGYTAQEIKSLSAYDFVAPEEHEDMKAGLMRILSNKTEGQEINLITKYGKSIPYYWRGNTIKLNGETTFVIVGLNISEQKKMESALIEEKKLADALINSLPGVFYMLDKNASFIKVNKNFIDEFGFDESELKSISPFDLYANDDIELLAKKLDEVFEKGFADVELNPITKDGKHEPYYFKAIRLDRGGESFVIGTGHSVKEQKQREKDLEASVHEKQVLLQEIHHRVKNNLAVISGLLELQVNEHEDPEFQRLVLDSQRRIQTMAIIHEKLYQSESLSQISMLLYMNDLIQQIGNSFNVDRKNIKIETSIDDVELSINQAIPFALAMNEIVSNALEHAFKNKNGGLLEVELKEEDDKIHTIIRDNGVGFNPDEAKKRSSSLGMTLINALLTQVGAEWTVKSENGVTYDIVFRKAPVEFLTDK